MPVEAGPGSPGRSVDLLDSGPVEPYLPVELAGSGPGRLHETLARANEAGRAVAHDLVAAWLPGVPHDDRPRDRVIPSHSKVGDELAARVTGEGILSLLDDVDAHPGRVTLNCRGQEGTNVIPLDEVRHPLDRPARATLNPARLLAHLSDGALLQIRRIDLVVPALAQLAEAVERVTGSEVVVRAMVSVGSTEGMGRHADRAEQWVVQVEGRKRWSLWEPTIPWYDHDRKAPGNTATGEAWDVAVAPGEVVVVPRGHMHRVDPCEDVSISLGIVINAPSRARLLETHVEGVGADVRWTEPIHAAGAAPTAPAAVPDLGADGWERALRGELARDRARRPGRHVEGASRVLRALAGGSLGELRLRTPLGGGVHFVDDLPWTGAVTVAAGGRVLRLTRRCLPILEPVFSGVPFLADDLPWEGSRQALVDLLGALVAEGLIGAVPRSWVEPDA